MDSFSAFKRLPDWACRDVKSRWFSGTDCGLPFGIPNQFIGAKVYDVGTVYPPVFEPGSKIKNVLLTNVTIAGHSASALVNDAKAFKLINVTNLSVHDK